LGIRPVEHDRTRPRAIKRGRACVEMPT